MAKISFEVVSDKYKPDEGKKIEKISFFWHYPFSGYADKPKKVKIANRHAKIIIKMYFKHYFYICYGITHSVCGILLPK